MNILEQIENFVEQLGDNPPAGFGALVDRYRESGALLAAVLGELAEKVRDGDLSLERRRLATAREEIKAALIESFFLADAGKSADLEISSEAEQPSNARWSIALPSPAERSAAMDAWIEALGVRGAEIVALDPATSEVAEVATTRPWVEDSLLVSALEFEAPELRQAVRQNLRAYWEWKTRWAQAGGPSFQPVMGAWLDSLADRLELASAPMSHWLVLLEACSLERAVDAARGKRHQPLTDLVIRLEWMERHSPSDDINDSCRLLRQYLATRRLGLHAERLANPDALAREAGAHPADKNARAQALWTAYHAGTGLQREAREVLEDLVSSERPLNGERRAALREALEAHALALDGLRSVLRSSVHQLPGTTLEAWRRDIVGRADDVFSMVASREPEWSCAALGALREDVDWIVAEHDRRLAENPPNPDAKKRAQAAAFLARTPLRPAKPPEGERFAEGASRPAADSEPPPQPTPEDFARARARLEKIQRDAANEHREMMLQQRVERVLTRPGANALDLLVNVLIIFVLGLLCVFTFVWHPNPTSELAMAFERLDALVCAVLLFEFFLKLSLSESPRWYFKKRWFTDLLPSIPVGYFAMAYAQSLLGASGAAHAANLGRLARVLRVVRLARFLRYLRLISFMQRIVDRMTRKFRSLIDVNVRVFGEHQIAARQAEDPLEAFQAGVDHLRGAALEQTARSLRGENRSMRLFWRPQMASIEFAANELSDAEVVSQEPPKGSGVRDMRVEQVVEALRELEDVTVEERLGVEGTRQVASYLRFLGPLLFPLLGVRHARRLGNGQLVASAGRRLAAAMDWALNSVINSFRDLYGIVTAAEMFSFTGGFISKVFKRHKNRLFFGVFILFVGYLLVRSAEGSNAWLLSGEIRLAQAIPPEALVRSMEERGKIPSSEGETLPKAFLRYLEVTDVSREAKYALRVSATARIDDLDAEEAVKERLAGDMARAIAAEAPASASPVRMDLLDREADEASGEPVASRWRFYGDIRLAVARDAPGFKESLKARLAKEDSELASGLEVEDRSEPAVEALRVETQVPSRQYSDPSDARRVLASHLRACVPREALAEPIDLDVSLKQAAAATIGKALQKSFGAVLVILGVVGFTAVAAGNWLVNRAGSLVDEHMRVAEAQFINLMEDFKKHNVRRDLRLILDRVLKPELKASEVVRLHADDRLLAMMRGKLLAAYGLDFATEASPEAPKPPAPRPEKGSLEDRYRLLVDRVMLLYRDYLDGAVLHYTDTKTTEQLLGNIAVIEAVERASYSPRERRKLEQLDLAKSRSIFGPYVWLYFITNSISQKVGAKVIEFNRVYKTNDFDALHFLSNDPEREAGLAEMVGEEAVERLRAERRDIIRSVFGTYPLPETAVNFFRLYRERYEGGVRIFLLPVDAVRLLFLGIATGLKRFGRLTAEFVNPPENPTPPPSSYAGREVANRKIHRMRKPIFLAALDLRARVDLTYLDLVIPGCDFAASEGLGYQDDMDLIGASPAFRNMIAERRELYSERIQMFKRALPKLALPKERKKNKACLRAWHTACCLNERDVATLLEAEKNLERAFNHARVRRGWPEEMGLLGRFAFGLKRQIRKIVGWKWLAPAEKPLLDFLEARGQLQDPPTKLRWLVRAYLLDFMRLRQIVDTVLKHDAARDAPARAVELLQEFADEARRTQNQLVAVRAVQTLAVLDVLNYQQIVEDIGEFEIDETPGVIPKASKAATMELARLRD